MSLVVLSYENVQIRPEIDISWETVEPAVKLGLERFGVPTTEDVMERIKSFYNSLPPEKKVGAAAFAKIMTMPILPKDAVRSGQVVWGTEVESPLWLYEDDLPRSVFRNFYWLIGLMARGRAYIDASGPWELPSPPMTLDSEYLRLWITFEERFDPETIVAWDDCRSTPVSHIRHADCGRSAGRHVHFSHPKLPTWRLAWGMPDEESIMDALYFAVLWPASLLHPFWAREPDGYRRSTRWFRAMPTQPDHGRNNNYFLCYNRADSFIHYELRSPESPPLRRIAGVLLLSHIINRMSFEVEIGRVWKFRIFGKLYYPDEAVDEMMHMVTVSQFHSSGLRVRVKNPITGETQRLKNILRYVVNDFMESPADDIQKAIVARAAREVGVF